MLVLVQAQVLALLPTVGVALEPEYFQLIYALRWRRLHLLIMHSARLYLEPTLVFAAAFDPCFL